MFHLDNLAQLFFQNDHIHSAQRKTPMSEFTKALLVSVDMGDTRFRFYMKSQTASSKTEKTISLAPKGGMSMYNRGVLATCTIFFWDQSGDFFVHTGCDKKWIYAF